MIFPDPVVTDDFSHVKELKILDISSETEKSLDLATGGADSSVICKRVIFPPE